MINKYIEKIPRSLAKVLSWRIIIIGQYFAIGYFTTGSIAFGAGLAGATTIINSTIEVCMTCSRVIYPPSCSNSIVRTTKSNL